MSRKLITGVLACVTGGAIIGLPATVHATEYPPPPPTSDRPSIAGSLKPALKPASVVTSARLPTTSTSGTLNVPGR